MSTKQNFSRHFRRQLLNRTSSAHRMKFRTRTPAQLKMFAGVMNKSPDVSERLRPNYGSCLQDKWHLDATSSTYKFLCDIGCVYNPFRSSLATTMIAGGADCGTESDRIHSSTFVYSTPMKSGFVSLVASRTSDTVSIAPALARPSLALIS
jgi:hypothetical protein